MRHFILFIFLFISFNHSFAQTNASEIIVGKAYQLPSVILNDTVTIQISTPQQYNETKEIYPVLYVLDGQWFFSHGLSIRADFTERNGSNITPEFILVGITTPNAKRGEWTMGKPAYFLDFIEKEIFPFIDKNYRTSNERLLFGWEVTGGFVIKSLQLKPNLFDAYIAASPAPLYGSYFPFLKNEYKAFELFLETHKELDKYLFIGEGESDYPVEFGTKVLDSLLKKKAPKPFNWKHKKIMGLSHQMCAYATMQQGLQDYYHYFSPLKYNSKTEFENLGGLEYMKLFYQKRKGKVADDNNDKYKQTTQRNLIFVAITEDDYKWFDFLFENFKNDDFLDNSFAPHINDYAHFYLKNHNTEKALEIINFVISKYPDKAEGYNSLGDIYSDLDKMEEAVKFYKKAVNIGTENDDWRIEEYKNDLKKLLTENKRD
jgi:predicted alpha/beta superfamily hydrolase